MFPLTIFILDPQFSQFITERNREISSKNILTNLISSNSHYEINPKPKCQICRKIESK